MKLEKNKLLRAGTFAALVAVVLMCLNSFFQPAWPKWNNYYTTKGFYEEPKNTIETVFLGSSVVASSASPMEMYKEYGINGYNLGMAQQPLLCSYYWLEEAYRLHPESLKTVVLDASSLRSDTKESFYHRAFDNMRLSDVKIRAVYNYMKKDIGRTLTFLSPLMSYHSRWSSLERTDFDKYTFEEDNGTRGFYLIKSVYADKSRYKNVKTKNPVLDTDAEPSKLLKRSLEYLDLMVKFCEENDLNLLLIKTSAENWNSSLHNAVQDLADSYNVEFLDFNFDPYYSLNGDFIHGFDTNDGSHLNYFGSVKFSKWLGKYLVDNYGATDVREDPKYDFMKDQLEEYEKRVTQSVNLTSSETLREYLEIAVSGNNMVMISVNENGATSLSKADRAYFKEIGLKKLAKLSENESYLAVISNGEVIRESRRAADHENTASLTYRNNLPNGKVYKIVSGGKNHGSTAEILIDGEAQLETGRGINLVVYSNEFKTVLGADNFDTQVSTSRDCYGLKVMNFLIDGEGLDKKYSPDSVRGRIVQHEKNIQAYRKNAG